MKNTPRRKGSPAAVILLGGITPFAIVGSLVMVGVPIAPNTVETCIIDGFSGGRGGTSYIETSCGQFYVTSDVEDANIGDEYELTLKHTLIETRIIEAVRA